VPALCVLKLAAVGEIEDRAFLDIIKLGRCWFQITRSQQ